MLAEDPDDGGEVFLEALHALVCDFRWRDRDLGFDVFVCRFWNLDSSPFAVSLNASPRMALIKQKLRVSRRSVNLILGLE